jgi:hypothetical protein
MNMISTHHNYDNGYIGLVNLSLEGLPKTVSVQGHTLHLKQELHISLICAKRIAPIINAAEKDKIEAKIVTLFKAFIGDHSLDNFSLLSEFRFVERDKRKTLVVMVEVPGLELFFKQLEEKYQTELPLQPTHITLYTLQPEAGIGILSPEELEQYSTVVTVPELAELQPAK